MRLSTGSRCFAVVLVLMSGVVLTACGDSETTSHDQDTIRVTQAVDTPERPKEFAQLDRFLGTWTVIINEEQFFGPDPVTVKIKGTIRWIPTSGNRFIDGSFVGTSGDGENETKVMIKSLATWEQATKKYRFWNFATVLGKHMAYWEGPVVDVVGTWDEKTSSFTTVCRHRSDGTTAVGTTRFINKDHFEFDFVGKDSTGKTTLKMRWTHVRQP